MLRPGRVATCEAVILKDDAVDGCESVEKIANGSAEVRLELLSVV